MEFKCILKENVYFSFTLNVLSYFITDITATFTQIKNEVYLL